MAAFMRLFAVLILAVISLPALAASPPAGTQINNRAEASYVPFGQTLPERIYSNIVTATVAPVESFTLVSDWTINAAAGSQVVLIHTITNTGNVDSVYAFNLANLAGDDYDLTDLRLYEDLNGNGIVDDGVPALLLNTGTLHLRPGESATLLLVAIVPLNIVGTAEAQLTLSASTTSTAPITQSNTDTIRTGSMASVQLTKRADQSGTVYPGTVINYYVVATNTGDSPAMPSPTAGPDGASAIVIDGQPATVFLMRDVIPAGTTYEPGSLATSIPGAIRLYRLASDLPFRYRTNGDDIAAVEVAVASTTFSLNPNNTTEMRFAVRVKADYTGLIPNVADAYFNDGTRPINSISNPVVLEVPGGSIGLAKRASVPVYETDPTTGAPLGTAKFRLSFVVQNFGTETQQDVQITDILEGAERFGTYTSNAQPGPGQYTIVAGSAQVSTLSGIASLAFNPNFNGTAANAGLLAAGGSLLPSASAEVSFELRMNVSGIDRVIYNSATATATTGNGTLRVSDVSVDGSVPDANGDGDPSNDTKPTPILISQPSISVSKTASEPRPVASGVYEVDYTITVTNSGQSVASHVRVADNLNCTFMMYKSPAPVQSWQLMTAPTAQNGLLIINGGYTGAATCSTAQIENQDPYVAMPREPQVMLTDGTQHLNPGASEVIRMTVRFTIDPLASMADRVFTNIAYAGSFSQVDTSSGQLLAAAKSAAVVRPIDPSGVVYNSVTREPVAGAQVRLVRLSCEGAAAGPITADQLLAVPGVSYNFNADGSVSMTTAANGYYQFNLLAPPIDSNCQYGLSVTLPADSGLQWPSTLIPATSGTAPGGMVQPQGTAPTGDQSTVYYLLLRLGPNLPEVFNNHIPVDPAPTSGLLMLEKEGNKRIIEIGSSLEYTLRLKNMTGKTLTGFTIEDRLPLGFRYVNGSARLGPLKISDPLGAPGAVLTFQFPNLTLENGQSVTLLYRAQSGVGTPLGDAVNRAKAFSGNNASNTAAWKIEVEGGVFSDEAYLIGKVFMDCNGDGVQGHEEIGIPGVRLLLEDGTGVVTDVEGKYSLYGLRAITRVLKLDSTTLPDGARLAILDSRNSGRPDSRFVDLKKGELHKANFAVDSCEDPSVLAEVQRRRQALAEFPDAEGEAVSRVRLDLQDRVDPNVDEVRRRSASGELKPTGVNQGQTDVLGSAAATSTTAVKGTTAVTGTTDASGSTATATPATAMPVTETSSTATATGSTPAAGSSPADSADTTAMPAPDAATAAAPATATGASGAGSKAVFESVMPRDLAGPSALPESPVSTLPRVDLELLLPEQDNKLGFIDLKDGDTLPMALANVRVKGRMDAILQLTVNDKKQAMNRVGKRAKLADKMLEAWEYIGVELLPGENVLLLEEIDTFGNVRGSQTIRLIAPGKLGRIEIDAPKTAVADAATPIRVVVRLTDDKGVPVTARTQLVLELDNGRWETRDLNPNEPGTQVFIEGGEAEFTIIPPNDPLDGNVRVSSGVLQNEVKIAYLPELRPLIGAGILEGVIDFRKKGPVVVNQNSNAFEQTLRNLSWESDDGKRSATARAAFFLKGTVKGEYLLTMAYDSDKETGERLFRDIQPDKFYPIYGDSSAKLFDAQSTERFYLRIDKNKSWLLYGDFTTDEDMDIRRLSQFSRAATGVKLHHENENISANAFASHNSLLQVVVEIPANGTSGPYQLTGNGELYENSERVEILVRDRNQPSLILQTTAMTRFTDYIVEPLTKQIRFSAPVASVDQNLNPRTIRVTYEVESGGPSFWMGGADAQYKINDNLQIGASYARDDNPDNPTTISGATAVVKLGERSVVTAEIAQSDTEESGSGMAGRIEWVHEDDNFQMRAEVTKSDSDFDNVTSGFGKGRTEATADASYKINEKVSLIADANYSKDDIDGGERSGMSASVVTNIGEYVKAELGIRISKDNPGGDFNLGSLLDELSEFGTEPYGSLPDGSSPFGNTPYSGFYGNQEIDLMTVRGRLGTSIPWLNNAQTYLEVEQDVRDSDKRMVAIGGDYQISEKSRIYGRYEAISSLGGLYTMNSSSQNNVAVIGLESAYMNDGRTFNEFRVRDAISGRELQAASGARRTWQITDNLRLGGSFERTKSFGGVDGNDSTALTGALEYSGDSRYRLYGTVEGRVAETGDSYLNTLGLSYKVDKDWSLLARSAISLQMNDSDDSSVLLSRQQMGFAWRQVDRDRWNALGRYEYYLEDVDGGISPFKEYSHNISLHANYQPERTLIASTRYAFKWGEETYSGLSSDFWAHLIYGRVTKDLFKNVDASLQAAYMWGQDGAGKHALGLEVGYHVFTNLWLSLGYNFSGFSDDVLTESDYLDRGVYLRLRYKFDEGLLK